MREEGEEHLQLLLLIIIISVVLVVLLNRESSGEFLQDIMIVKRIKRGSLNLARYC
jgi:hypothetical protein